MTARGQWFAQGSCLLCGRLFAFDPERVCSHPWPPPDGPLAPICRPCITERVNPERRRRGLPQFPILPGATSTSDRRPAGEWPPLAALLHSRRLHVIYVEHHHGPERTEVGWIDWRPGWYAVCDECGWTAGPCRSETDAHAAADAHDLAMGETTPQELRREAGERLAVAWQVRHGRRPNGWWFAVQVLGRPREEHGPFASEPEMLAAKVARMQELEAAPSERPAQPGERCACGRQAVIVYLGSVFGPTGYCGMTDGGDQGGPCPFCHGPRHTEPDGRCPDYRLRLDQP